MKADKKTWFDKVMDLNEEIEQVLEEINSLTKQIQELDKRKSILVKERETLLTKVIKNANRNNRS